MNFLTSNELILSNRESVDSNRFIITFFIWIAILFGLFYWGKYWTYSPVGEAIDGYIRSLIMPILSSILDNAIIDYDIVINSEYRVVITPECNGLIPYLMILSAILAYNGSIFKKAAWAILSFFIFFAVNILRLFLVVNIVSEFGTNYFYFIHDIIGNLLLVSTGLFIFLSYIKGSKE